MHVLIIDDEAKARRILKSLCEQYCPEVKTIATADAVITGLASIQKQNPDIVFLDIEMPEQNGFFLLDQFEDALPFDVIFTTAYDEYAVKAFKYAAVDYLLKPIEIDELVTAVDKVRMKMLQPKDEQLNMLKQSLKTYQIDKIALTTLDGYTFVRFDDIVRCEAEGNYTKVFLSDGSSLLITKTLKYYEDMLKEKHFFRVHKSHLINLNYVRKFIKGKQCAIETIDNEIIEVSARKRDALLQQLSLVV